MQLVSDKRGYQAAGAVCRRRVFGDGNKFAVVFTSDRDACGRSITNQFEDLAQATARELARPAGSVRWFEHRTDEPTAGGYKQQACFEEVTFGGGEAFSSPVWQPADLSAFEREAGTTL